MEEILRTSLKNKGFTIFGLLNWITILTIILVLVVGLWGRFSQGGNLKKATQTIKMSITKALNKTKESDAEHQGVFLDIGNKIRMYTREGGHNEYENKIFDDEAYEELSLPAGMKIAEMFVLNTMKKSKLTLEGGEAVSIVFPVPSGGMEIINEAGPIIMDENEVFVIVVKSSSAYQYLIIDLNQSKIEIKDQLG